MRANQPLHRIAARLRFGVNMNSLVWAANGDCGRWTKSPERRWNLE
jgi:hypothetical protein